MKKRCMGCMEEYSEEYRQCPYCGYVDGTSVEEQIHLEPGTILRDRYVIGRVLGFGGFDVTYIGWDNRLEIKVAVKEYLPSEFSTRMPGQTMVTVFRGEKQEQFREGLKKFVDEAKRLANFKNEDGVVKVYDSFAENETAYIVMEYLEGETLSAFLEREGTIPEDRAVEMIMPVMKSLQVIHSAGILHRDIAPDNIFITKDGKTKLIDFGASRYATTSHSRSLTVIIKPGYSPEEQYRSTGDQGTHTDVYALGATLYKMMTGKTPPDAMERRAQFEGQNKDILIEPRKINKNISQEREVAILNAMNVRVQDRTSNVPILISELESEYPAKRRYGKIKKIDVFAWPLWVKIAIPVVLILILTFGIMLTTGVIPFPVLFTDEVNVPDGYVVTPNVEGMSVEEAFEKLIEEKLQPKLTDSVISDYVAPDTIISQTPSGGQYSKRNSEISLICSKSKGKAGEQFNGTTGDCQWMICEDGTLIVYGNGRMADYAYTEAPWYSNRQIVNRIVFKEGVTLIGKYAFIDFENLSEIQFSKTVTTINDAAFYNCDALKNVTIPSTVTSIGFNGFGSCNSLSYISVEADNTQYSSVDGNLYDKSGKTIILYAIGKTASAFNVPDGITVIYDDVFEQSEYLTEITIPNSVISIGRWAFEYCKNLKKVTIPASVTTIGDKAFENCSSELLIYGKENSYTQSYAQEQGITFLAQP